MNYGVKDYSQYNQAYTTKQHTSHKLSVIFGKDNPAIELTEPVAAGVLAGLGGTVVAPLCTTNVREPLGEPLSRLPVGPKK